MRSQNYCFDTSSAQGSQDARFCDASSCYACAAKCIPLANCPVHQNGTESSCLLELARARRLRACSFFSLPALISLQKLAARHLRACSCFDNRRESSGRLYSSQIVCT